MSDLELSNALAHFVILILTNNWTHTLEYRLHSHINIFICILVILYLPFLFFLILAPPCTLYRLVIEILLTNGRTRLSFCQGEFDWLDVFVLNVLISFGMMIKYRNTQTGRQRLVEREINILFCQNVLLVLLYFELFFVCIHCVFHYKNDFDFFCMYLID